MDPQAKLTENGIKRKPTTEDGELLAKNSSTTKYTSLITNTKTSDQKENEGTQVPNGDVPLSIEEILHHVDILSNDPNIVVKALATMQDLCKLPEDITKALDAGLVLTLLLITDKFSADPHVQSHACELLAEVTNNGGAMKFSWSQGIVKICLRAMENFRCESYIQENALAVLVNICEGSEETATLEESGRYIVKNSKVMQLTWSVFDENEKEPLVVGRLCCLISLLLECKEVCRTSMFIPARVFCIAHQALIFYGGDSVAKTAEHEQNVLSALKLLDQLREFWFVGIIEIGSIICVMQNWGTSLTVVEVATQAISRWCPIVLPTTEAKLILDVVAAATRAFPESCYLHHEAFFVLGQLCLESPERAVHCVKNLDILSCVKSAFEKFRHCAAFVDNVSFLLESLATHQELRKDLATAKGWEILAEVLRFYSDDSLGNSAGLQHAKKAMDLLQQTDPNE